MSSVHTFRESQIAVEAIDWIDRLKDSSLETREAFSEWITRSADHVHQFLLATAIAEEASRAVGYGAFGGIAVAADSLITDWDQTEVAQIVRAIGQLPEQCRQVVTLRKVYGCSWEEIADRLHVTESAVQQAMSMGARRLASLLSADRYRVGRFPARIRGFRVPI